MQHATLRYAPTQNINMRINIFIRNVYATAALLPCAARRYASILMRGPIRYRPFIHSYCTRRYVGSTSHCKLCCQNHSDLHAHSNIPVVIHTRDFTSSRTGPLGPRTPEAANGHDVNGVGHRPSSQHVIRLGGEYWGGSVQTTSLEAQAPSARSGGRPFASRTPSLGAKPATLVPSWMPPWI